VHPSGQTRHSAREEFTLGRRIPWRAGDPSMRTRKSNAICNGGCPALHVAGVASSPNRSTGTRLRGFDIANMTLIEGKSGWIVVDPLTARQSSRQSARQNSAAALAFARQYLVDRSVSAINFTHSHADHFGGALGVASAQEIGERKIPVIAPEGYMDEATSENVLVGTAMASKGVDRSFLIDMLNQTPIERFLEAMAGGLDGPAAEGKVLKVNLVLTDIQESCVLWIENAVLHFKKAAPAADANSTLTLTKPIVIKMMAGTAGVKDTLLSDDLKVDGSKIDLVRFFSLMDKAPVTFAIVTK